MEDKLKQISTRDGTTYLYTVFRLLGIDNKNNTWAYTLYSLQLNFTSCVLQLIGFTTSYVISSSKMSTNTFLTSLQVAINVYSVTLKVIVLYFSMPQFEATRLIFDSLDAKVESKGEYEIAERMVRFCKRLILIYMASYFTYSTSTFLAAIYNGHPPYAIYIPFCYWEDSKIKLIIASLIEFYLINVSCLQDVGCDAYPVVFIYIARMHIQILCMRVEQLGKSSSKSKEDNVKMLIDCIDTHRTILRLVETVRPIISKTIFIQLIVTAAVLAITFINIMMFANLFSAIGSMFFLFAVTLEVFPMCYIMNVLMEEINNLPTSLFHCEWVDQNKTFRNMIVFSMQNAQKFNNIIAGNILPIQVSTFITIAKLAFSIYALVKQSEARISSVWETA